MNFRVWMTTPRAIVIDEHGNPVPNSYVHQISFPQTSIDTAHGKVWVISGPATAVVSVNGIYYADVPCVSTP